MRKNMREIKRKEGRRRSRKRETGRKGTERKGNRKGTQGAIMKDWGVEWLWGFEEIKG